MSAVPDGLRGFGLEGAEGERTQGFVLGKGSIFHSFENVSMLERLVFFFLREGGVGSKGKRGPWTG